MEPVFDATTIHLFLCCHLLWSYKSMRAEGARLSFQQQHWGTFALPRWVSTQKGGPLWCSYKTEKARPPVLWESDSFLRRHPKCSSGRQFSMGELTAKSVQLVAHMSKRERQLTAYAGLLIWHGHGHPDLSRGGPKKQMILSGLCLQTEMSLGT